MNPSGIAPANATRNEDLQAGHQILTVLEQSKSRSEEWIDHFPGVHGVIDRHGRLLRVNQGLALLLGRPPEALIGLNLSQIFSGQGWDRFQSLAGLGLAEAASRKGDFELEIQLSAVSDPESFLWQVSPFPAGTHDPRQLYSVMGRSVQDYKTALEALLTTQKDHELASAVQGLLLPKQSRFSNPTVDVAAFYRPASNTGGDWWWVEERTDGSTLLFIADVLGHGAGPAMLTAAIAGSARTVRTLAQDGGVPSVPAFFEAFHQTLIHFCQGNYWMTVTVAEILPDLNQVKIWNTGGPAVFHLTAEGAYKALFKPGTPVGSTPLEISELSHSFHPGDRLLLYTDGMFNFESAQGRTFGHSRFRKTFVSAHGKSIEEARAILIGEFDYATREDRQRDDAAFILVDRRSE